MSLDQATQARSIHRRAFEHYLRTGERLTDTRWFAGTIGAAIAQAMRYAQGKGY